VNKLLKMEFIRKLGSQPNRMMHKQLLNWKHLPLTMNAMVRWAGACAGVALAMLALPAHADVWGFVDEQGVAHFASFKNDDRYELYFKGNTGFDPKEGVPFAPSSEGSANGQIARQGNVPKLSPKLVAFFDVSPSFKAVKHHLREASNLHKIDFELLQALIATESGFDTLAVSPKGAVGLMQLMPPTAQRYGVQADAKTTIEKKLTDPKINIRAGSRYLRDLLAMFPGKPELALAAYNAGEGAVKRYGNTIPPYLETQNYVKTVMQIYTTLKPPPSIALKLAENRQAPGRVRVELNGAPQTASGGATGRGNMVPPLAGAAPMPGPATPPDVPATRTQ
jgi:Transglycosylase SLT domain